MYESLIKWGFEQISNLAIAKDKRDVQIMIEAIKTKNALVVERFKYAWDTCQSIVDLSVQVDEGLIEFQSKAPETKRTKKSAFQFLGALKNDFHPKYYRQLKKLRIQLESTNDLLSAYSSTFVEMVNFGMLQNLVEHKKTYSGNFILRNYRGLWTLYAEILTSLVRITSNDLRFWLTDTPYVVMADEYALNDFDAVRKFLFSEEWHGKRFHLSLETEEGMGIFWNHMEQIVKREHNKANSADAKIRAAD
jgi:hypothetical protein